MAANSRIYVVVEGASQGDVCIVRATDCENAKW